MTFCAPPHLVQLIRWHRSSRRESPAQDGEYCSTVLYGCVAIVCGAIVKSVEAYLRWCSDMGAHLSLRRRTYAKLLPHWDGMHVTLTLATHWTSSTLLCDLFHSLWMRRSAAPLSSLPQISPGEPGVSLTPSWFRPNLPVPSGVCVSTVWLGKKEKMWTKLSWLKFFLQCCWSLWFLTTALELQWAGSFFMDDFLNVRVVQ